MRVLFLLTILLFQSCSSFVQSVHRQINNEEKMKRMRYARAMQKRYGDQRPIQNPVTLNGQPSANSQRNLDPNIKRKYSNKGVRRYKASDLIDNDNDGSLWSGKNSESFLFVNNSLKQKGDIVIVEVMKDFKDKIQDELKRAFPRAQKKKVVAKKGEEEKPAEAATPAKKEDQNKVYDKISSVVVEQVNQDYLLIRGKKEIMYKSYKRYFEIQAIVSQKDISSRDSVSSLKLLEPKINVLRY